MQRIPWGGAIYSDRNGTYASRRQRSQSSCANGKDRSRVDSDHAGGTGGESIPYSWPPGDFWLSRNSGEDVDVQVRAELAEFIVTNYLFGDAARAPRDEDSLVEGGIIDSTGILELIEFLESHFGIEVSEAETVPENLDSISSLTQFVVSKKAVRETSP